MALDVDAVSVEGVWYRHIPHRGSVWWWSEPPSSGRWQRGSVASGFYLTDSRETAWAEWYRQLAEAALRPRQALPRDLWRFRLSIDRIADLRNARRLDRVGLSVPRPARSEWPLFQAVGEQLYREHWRGVLAPSAARPVDGRILCLFRDTREIPGVHPVPPPAIHRQPPVPPSGLRT